MEHLMQERKNSGENGDKQAHDGRSLVAVGMYLFS